MSKTIRLLALSLTLLLAPISTTRAASIIGNLPKTFNSLQTRTGAFGTGFTMTGEYLLTSATFVITVPGAGPTLQLFSDSGGNPSSPLLTFTNPAFGSGSQSYTFTAPSAFDLRNRTTYWLVLQGMPSIGYQVGAGTPTGPGATDAGQRFDPAIFPPTTPINIIQYFQVDGNLVTAVPEPSSLTLLGLGVAAILVPCLFRRKRPA